jgi:hypothetical protein
MNGKPGLHGYLWIEIDGVNYTAQDLAWMYAHGSLPDGVIMENLHLVRETDLTSTDPKAMQVEIKTIRKAEASELEDLSRTRNCEAIYHLGVGSSCATACNRPPRRAARH